MPSLITRSVVYLLDNTQRDLLAATLIARHLASRGIRCHIEPLEAYRSCLAAHRPDMIIFNHLTAGHLVAYSRKLATMGVASTVLTNEGITYDPALLKFIVGNHHSNAHIDLFLCWNSEMKRELEESGVVRNGCAAVVGIPRFDFYCHPWSRVFKNDAMHNHGLPRVLFCTNFAFADYKDTPTAGEQLFGSLVKAMPIFRNHQTIFDTHHRYREKIFGFLGEIARSGRYHLIVRPHPYEKRDTYERWLISLPAEHRHNVTIDKDSNITQLILSCEIEISCETCTTAMEGWIAGKPTIEVVLERHPLFFHEEQANHNPLCDDPRKILTMLDTALQHPLQETYRTGRRAHLKKWCHSPDGIASQCVADEIAKLLLNRPTPDWNQLTWNDRRRGWKLKLMRAIGEPYHYDPFLGLKHMLFPKRYALRHFAYIKAARASDILKAKQFLEEKLLEAAPTIQKAK